nr:MAG TPA_asm: hypothetical protein [Caudoviricetes sp.]
MTLGLYRLVSVKGAYPKVSEINGVRGFYCGVIIRFSI